MRDVPQTVKYFILIRDAIEKYEEKHGKITLN